MIVRLIVKTVSSGLKLPFFGGISCNLLQYSVLHAANAFFSRHAAMPESRM